MADNRKGIQSFFIFDSNKYFMVKLSLECMVTSKFSFSFSYSKSSGRVLYYIINSEKTGTIPIKSYINLIYPILVKDKLLEVSEDTYNKLKPFFIQPNRTLNEINIDDYFSGGVQHTQIENEKIIIKQLYNKGYLTYKDDETGMLVIKEF
ncbi:hypothetical protein OKW21_005412 [Catalinimonas alkaloidigena]|uniref:hypothetical protein n=1 Tax=Catalinimonas alkaloidigena TaxID=1075417 RepID=UPI0024060BBF|nr:hypothetical protein [Catalinimonas alkaloidigena]MDF9800149.1 hypothetical protein [Catalinimonas alkaloidigena]